jgi:hypothetical protein
MQTSSDKTLRTRSPRIRTSGGVFLLIFGSIFTLAGLGVILVASGHIPVDESSFHAPKWVLGAVGAVFFLAGAGIEFSAINSIRFEYTRKQKAQTHPDELWLADYSWDPRGTADDGPRKIRQTLIGTILMAIFLIPFNWWAFASGEGPIPVKFIVGLFDTILLFLTGHFIYLVLQRIKYGGARLEFERFPFFIGESVDCYLVTSHGIGNFDSFAVTLRCIEEREEVIRSGSSTKRTIVYKEKYRDEKRFEGSGNIDTAMRRLPISFALPDDAPITHLKNRPGRYWELEVKAETAGIDYAATFLVPVYAPPAAV